MAAGYPFKIFKTFPGEKYICLECKLIIRDPAQTFCGHRYCMSCLERLIARQIDPVYCAGCKREGVEESVLKKEEMYRDRAIMQELRGFAVQCLNEGCTWTGHFKDYEQEHVEACPFELIHCMHTERCGVLIKRKDLSTHLERDCLMRMVTCQYCKREYQWKILQQHFDECDEIFSECQFCRNVSLPRNQLKAHQHPETGNCTNRPKVCKFKAAGCNQQLTEHYDPGRGECSGKLVPCKYKSVGCDALLQEQHLDVHYRENISLHIDLTYNRTLDIQAAIRDVEGDLTAIDGPEKQKKTSENQVRRLESALHKLQEEVLLLYGKQYGHPDQSANNKLRELNRKLPELERKITTYEGIVAVLNSQIERDAQQLKALERQRRQDRELIESLERKIKAQDRIIALKDVALAEQDLRIQSLEMTSYDGNLIWKISDFIKKLNEARSGKTSSIYSPCFFTCRHGYKMCARVYLNGDGMAKGNHVSLFFVIMKGPYDALLRWPFRQKVTFMWLDQNNREHVIDVFRPDPTSSSFQRPKNDMNIASGCPLFMPLSQIDSPRHAYVKDDVAFLKIIVDTSEIA